MIKTIIKGPDPILTKLCRPFVFGQDDQIIQDLRDTLKNHGNARGISAPQIGYDVQAFAANVKGASLCIFINPTFETASEETSTAEEGCLSYPWLQGVRVERPTSGSIKWTSENGNKHDLVFAGWDLRCILHEIDHCNGITLDTRRRQKK